MDLIVLVAADQADSVCAIFGRSAVFWLCTGKLFVLFTDSALWAGSVIESPCPCVCLSVCVYVPSGAVFLERSSSHHNFHTVRARDLKF